MSGTTHLKNINKFSRLVRKGRLTDCSAGAAWPTLLAMACVGCGTTAEMPSVAGSRLAIVGGEVDQNHPAVGVLTTSSGVCTATLIGETTALSAAHCIDGVRWARVQFGVSGDVRFSPFFEVERRLKHPSYDYESGFADLALLRLSGAPAQVVRPASLTMHPPAVGLMVELVGFGVSGEDQTDFGRRRAATSDIDVVQPARFGFLVGSAEQATSFCSGDSGGPTFATVDGAQRIVGVHSFNLRGCRQDGWDTRVDAFGSWVYTAAEGDARFDGSYEAPDGDGPASAEGGGCAVGEHPPPAVPLGLLCLGLLCLRPGQRARSQRAGEKRACLRSRARTQQPAQRPR